VTVGSADGGGVPALFLMVFSIRTKRAPEHDMSKRDCSHKLNRTAV
jgi:hypothetical protein